MVVDAATARNYLPTAVVGGEGGARPSVLRCEPGRDSRIKISSFTCQSVTKLSKNVTQIR